MVHFKSKCCWLIQVIKCFLLPLQAILIMVGMMIVLDTITGIWKARKTGEQITSTKPIYVISKMVLYQAGIITSCS